METLTRRALGLGCTCLLVTSTASATPDAAVQPHVPEPILTESITDIDTLHGGELELTANGSVMRTLCCGGGAFQTSLEAEWRATALVGLVVEPSVSVPLVPGVPAEFGVRTGVAVALWRDFVHDFYLQGEAVARLGPDNLSNLPDPGEASLPYDVDVRGAFRRGRWTVRGNLGAETDAANFGVRAGAAFMLALDRDSKASFVAVEASMDSFRANFMTLALNLSVEAEPLRFQLATPWTPALGQTPASIGIVLRVLVELDRD